MLDKLIAGSLLLLTELPCCTYMGSDDIARNAILFDLESVLLVCAFHSVDHCAAIL